MELTCVQHPGLTELKFKLLEEGCLRGGAREIGDHAVV